MVNKMAIEQVCDYSYCTACYACMAVCPKGAICHTINCLGEEIPTIDSSLCVECGRCISVCPANKNLPLKKAEFCYAGWSKSSDDQVKSSSGGIAAVLSRKTITDGGIVYGSISKDAKIFHERIDTSEGLELLRGSKYVKSDTRNCYQKIRKDLKSGKKVLFIGTPCQVAGVKMYVGNAGDNLLTVDLICHGTPPFSYLKEYLDKKCASGIEHKKWDTVSFRSPKTYLIEAKRNGKSVYHKEIQNDLYLAAFLKGLILRSNCYRCVYSCPERIGDITIGDFWGLDRKKLNVSYNGKISVILPNTEKGSAFLEECSELINLFKLSIEDALNPEQGNLLHPSVPHDERQVFERLYPRYGFIKALKGTDFGAQIEKKEQQKMIKNSITYRTIKKVYHMGKRIIK